MCLNRNVRHQSRLHKEACNLNAFIREACFGHGTHSSFPSGAGTPKRGLMAMHRRTATVWKVNFEQAFQADHHYYFVTSVATMSLSNIHWAVRVLRLHSIRVASCHLLTFLKVLGSRNYASVEKNNFERKATYEKTAYGPVLVFTPPAARWLSPCQRLLYTQQRCLRQLARVAGGSAPPAAMLRCGHWSSKGLRSGGAAGALTKKASVN